MTDDSKGQAGAGIQVTPRMIEAGVAELREKTLGEPLSEIVQDVFYVMLAASSISAS